MFLFPGPKLEKKPSPSACGRGGPVGCGPCDRLSPFFNFVPVDRISHEARRWVVESALGNLAFVLCIASELNAFTLGHIAFFLAPDIFRALFIPVCSCTETISCILPIIHHAFAKNYVIHRRSHELFCMSDVQ